MTDPTTMVRISKKTDGWLVKVRPPRIGFGDRRLPTFAEAQAHAVLIADRGGFTLARKQEPSQ